MMQAKYIIPFLCLFQSAQALIIDDYYQYNKSDIAGVAYIKGLNGSTSLDIEISIQNDKVDFDLNVINDDLVEIIINSNNNEYNNSDILTITAYTPNEETSRIFAINKSSIKPSPNYQNKDQNERSNLLKTYNKDIPKPQENVATLDQDIDDSVFNINIYGNYISNVRSYIEVYAIENGLELVEKKGDEKVLNAYLNNKFKVKTLDDLFIASNHAVKQILISNKRIRVLGHVAIRPKIIDPIAVIDDKDQTITVAQYLDKYAQINNLEVVNQIGDPSLELINIPKSTSMNISALYEHTQGQIKHIIISNDKIRAR